MTEKKVLTNEELLKLVSERGLLKKSQVKNYVVEKNSNGTYDLVYPNFRLNSISTSESHSERYDGYLKKIQQAARLAGYEVKIEKIAK
jgi:hypothetical protein